MLILLTDQEVLGAMPQRRDDGLWAVEIPDGRLRSNADRQAVLTFCESAKTVHCGKLSARLSAIQFSFLQHVYTHGKVTNESLADAAWGHSVSDNLVRATCCVINGKLLESGFSIELVCFRSRVFIETIC